MTRVFFRSLAVLVIALAGPRIGAQAAAPDAGEVLAAARAKATAEHKTILLHFGASWCSWCKRLEAFLHDDNVEPVLQRHFVLVRLAVRERDPHKDLENPGGMDVLARCGGAERGIPYTAVLAADGTMLANSLVKVDDPNAEGGQENLGYPGEPESITYFLGMLQTAAPDLTPEERRTLEAWLLAHQPQ